MPCLRLIARAALVLAALSPALPAAAQWLPAGPTDATPSLFARNGRAVFAADGSRRVTVHRSTDDGRTWANASPAVTNAGTQPTITGLAAGDAQQGLLVLSSNATGTAFYRSANDGASWTRVATLPTTQSTYDGLVATRSGAFATIGVASSSFERRLFVSTNGGATWTQRDSVFRASNEVLAVGDTLVRAYERGKRALSGAFYSEYGVAVSTDLGQSWTERALPNCPSGCLPGASSNAARWLGYGGGRLVLGSFASADLGLTWTVRPGPPGTLLRIAVGETRIVAALGSGGSFGFGLATDTTGAGAWRDVSAQAGLHGALRREVFWTGRSFLVGIEFGGVVRSEDGVNWAPAGRFPAHHNSFLATVAAHRGTLLSSTGNERILRSTDRGATWAHDYRTLPSLDDAAGFVSLDSVVLAGGQEGVYRSTDLQNWTPIATGLRNVDGFIVVNGRVLAGATGGLYERPASGTAWTQVLNHNLNQFDAGVSGSRVIVNGGNGSQRSYRISLDGGATWGPAGPSTGSFQVAATSRAFVTAATGIAIFGGGTFRRSLDDGATWHNLKPALGDSLAPNLLDNRGDTLLAIGQTYLAASLDHGTTWRKVPHTGLGFGFNAGSETNAPLALTRLGDTLYVAFAGNSVWKRSLADLGLAVAAAPDARPEALGLAVGPNPSPGPTAVAFALAAAGPVRLVVYDVLGREVALLHDGMLPAGRHRFVWTADAPAGTYLVRLTTGGTSVTQTMLRLR